MLKRHSAIWSKKHFFEAKKLSCECPFMHLWATRVSMDASDTRDCVSPGETNVLFALPAERTLKSD